MIMNLLHKLFPGTMDEVWSYGYGTARLEHEQDMKRLAVAIRDLDKTKWDYPKGTRREEVGSLMIEQSAQVVEAFK